MGPTATLSDARNAQRRADVNTLLNATWQYAIDNSGRLPAGIPLNDPVEVCALKQPVRPCADLGVLAGTYLVSIPSDPQAPEGRTWYSIVKSSENRVTVTAMQPESNVIISVTR